MLYSYDGTNNNTYVGLSSNSSASGNYAIWAGHATASSAKFRVTRAGALTATSATITGTVNATAGNFGNANNKIHIGGASGETHSAIYSASKSSIDAAQNGFYIGTNGIALGKYDSTTGNPFEVLPTGALTATSATITGTINATAGYIGNGTTDG